MDFFDRIRPTIRYASLTVVTFLILQSIVIIMHEFTHSTIAWLLGHMQSPLDIIWGNFLTMSGWDEGVEYKKIFASGHPVTAAIIGVSPLVLHTAIVGSGLILMRKGLPANKWLFHVLFWFVIANFMEIFAYIVMRSFVTSGDVGIFNRGLMLSPWLLFIAGSLAIVFGLYILFRQVMPHIYALFAKGDRLLAWTILGLTSFVLFLWGSGLRVILFVFPDPQWMFGLIGVAAFGLVMAVCKPDKI